MEDNSHAGQGAVLLDIGGTVGALVVAMPADLLGQEVEIRPVGAPAIQPHTHDGHTHDGHTHSHESPYIHVAVVNRPRDGAFGPPMPSAVFGELEQGDYELYIRPDGPVRLTATVRGAEVSFETWPS